MHFVTSKRAGYVLFCMTPSGRAAIGLTEDRLVHLFERTDDGSWRILREWPSETLSHTDLLLELGEHEEPEDPRRLLQFVPAS
ncbi:MAG: hypothetical protein OZ922_05675 [Myxococcales bacterium]|nr:hypothetical protein [Myxococcales bacterium]